MESQSQHRTLVDIISDTKSGEPLASVKDEKKRKREIKAQGKQDQALQKATSQIKKQASQEVKKEPEQKKPRLVLVNGKAVLEAPTIENTTTTIDKMTKQMGKVQASNQKMSSLNYTKHEKTDRWTKSDTQKFYIALQLFGTDFGLIETLFDGERSRNQIKVSL